MKRTLGFLVCAVALVGAVPSVCPAQNPSNYIVLKGGIYSPSDEFDVRDINGGVVDQIDPDSGFNGEIAVGHYFLPMLAVELGAGYFESEGVPPTEPGETKFRVVPILLTGKLLNFNITDAFFLGAEGRYLWAKPSFGGQDINLDGFTVTGNPGFRF